MATYKKMLRDRRGNNIIPAFGGQIDDGDISQSTFDEIGSYSTSEVATPFTWVDGKTIYRTVFVKTVSTIPVGDNTWAHGISNIAEITGIRTTFKLGWGTDTWGAGDYLSGSGYQIRVDKTNVILNNTTSATNWYGTFKIVIEYTKTS